MAEGDAKAARTEARFGQGFLTDIWYFACLSADLKPGRLARHEILGEPVLLGRPTAGRPFALRDICPHRPAPLSAGRFHRAAAGAEPVECTYPGSRVGPGGPPAALPPARQAGRQGERD